MRFLNSQSKQILLKTLELRMDAAYQRELADRFIAATKVPNFDPSSIHAREYKMLASALAQIAERSPQLFSLTVPGDLALFRGPLLENVPNSIQKVGLHVC